VTLAVGMVFLGYCGGYFGRNAYGEKRVEAFGADWIVARGGLSGKSIYCATFKSADDMRKCVEEFLKENEALTPIEPDQYS
jgi:hypothetical protein